jgi:hypothetical protein
MNRSSERLRRISRLVELRERSARRDLAAARTAHGQARSVLLDVFEQCRAVARDDQELSVAFGRALIEAGWLRAEAQEEACIATAAAVDTAVEQWSEHRNRLDALSRLIERMAESEAAERDQRERADFSELVTARWGRNDLLAEAVAS